MKMMTTHNIDDNIDKENYNDFNGNYKGNENNDNDNDNDAKY